jgi:hypothetical protein
MDTRNITGGSNNAAPAATNNDRFMLEFGMIPFFYGRIKSITIDMGNSQLT